MPTSTAPGHLRIRDDLPVAAEGPALPTHEGDRAAVSTPARSDDGRGGVNDMATVGEAMLTAPKVCDRSAVVADLRQVFEDDHVHCALVTDGTRLVSVVVRDDILAAGPDMPASAVGTLRGRTVAASADIQAVHRRMLEEGIRRLAVVTETGRLLGLLCLKQGGTGFCSDEGVAARAAGRPSDPDHPTDQRA
jgi:CBS domain-containing protein